MYPPLFVTLDERNTSQNIIYFDKKLCIELCGVFTCLSCVCVVYLIFFIHVINNELNMNMTLF